MLFPAHDNVDVRTSIAADYHHRAVLEADYELVEQIHGGRVYPLKIVHYQYQTVFLGNGAYGIDILHENF